MSVSRTVHLAESTVVEAERHARTYAVARTSRAPGRTRATAAVESVRFDPEIWQGQILPLAGGDPARIEIVDASTVVIHNGPGWWARRTRRRA